MLQNRRPALRGAGSRSKIPDAVQKSVEAGLRGMANQRLTQLAKHGNGLQFASLSQRSPLCPSTP